MAGGQGSAFIGYY